MKVLLLLVVIYSLQNLVRSHNGTAEETSILFRSYPKKVHPIYKHNQKLMNSGKIYKKSWPPVVKKTAKTSNLYSAFPKVATLPLADAPDSPYFPHNLDYEPKHRVKKVLNSRRKRSANSTKYVTVTKPAEASVKPKSLVKSPTPFPDKPKELKKKENKPTVNGPGITINKKDIVKHNRNVTGNNSKVARPDTKAISKGNNTKKGLLKKRAHPKTGKKVKVGKKHRQRNALRKRTLRNRHALRNGTDPINPRNSTNPERAKKRVGMQGKKRYLRSGQKRSPAGRPKARSSEKTSNVVPGGRRLIAARDARSEDYPYMVSIQKYGEHWCSGALLNRRLIISTANCFWKSSSISHLSVRAGARNVNSGGQVVRIQEVMKHPNWDIRKSPDNDVALAVLNRNIKFDHGVHAVDLPNRVMLPPFDDAWVTSFGADRRDGIYSQRGRTLQVYHVRLLEHARCNNITQRFGIAVTRNFICLAQTGKRAPCTRDTGAPAVSDGILWGLASWGIRKLCGTERFPAMFSYIASQTNMDFIINATRYLMADERYNPMLDRLPKRLPKTTEIPSSAELELRSKTVKN